MLLLEMAAGKPNGWSSTMILGVDTGGTFTDFVLLRSVNNEEDVQLRTHKVLSTPHAPEEAILQGIREMGLEDAVDKGDVIIVHGSTVATNAALEGKGATTAFITNTGFRDLLTIGRQTRPELYRLETPPIPPPVPRELCFETAGRLDSQGRELEKVDTEILDSIVRLVADQKPQAIAITLLFSFLDNTHEKEVAAYLEEHLDYSPFISSSHEVLPEYREYERGIATWLNASLGPLVSSYLLSLKRSVSKCRLSIMQSTGGTISADQAAMKSVNLLLSGPAGGLAAADYLARLTGNQKLMTFDMGGTSTDVALMDGAITLTSEGHIGNYPVAVPMVDMHTIGAGGGSIASLDAGGLLQVGPKSAGASPGPACYGKGGNKATVTDANLVLGRLIPSEFLGGGMTLDLDAASAAIQPLAKTLGLSIEEAAAGIIQVANEHMARALRVISVARGHDSQDFRLCCFGGAGGLHICALADAMGMKKAMVPVHGGVLSAMGMFLAPVQRQLSLTHQAPLVTIKDESIDAMFIRLEQKGLQAIKKEGFSVAECHTERSLDLRYTGQSSSLNVPFIARQQAVDDFHALHEQRYGHRLESPVELVNVRVGVKENKAPPTLARLDQGAGSLSPHKEKTVHGINEAVALIHRNELLAGDSFDGPALILETNATTWIEPGWTVDCDEFGNLMLTKAME